MAAEAVLVVAGAFDPGIGWQLAGTFTQGRIGLIKVADVRVAQVDHRQALTGEGVMMVGVVEAGYDARLAEVVADGGVEAVDLVDGDDAAVVDRQGAGFRALWVAGVDPASDDGVDFHRVGAFRCRAAAGDPACRRVTGVLWMRAADGCGLCVRAPANSTQQPKALMALRNTPAQQADAEELPGGPG